MAKRRPKSHRRRKHEITRRALSQPKPSETKADQGASDQAQSGPASPEAVQIIPPSHSSSSEHRKVEVGRHALRIWQAIACASVIATLISAYLTLRPSVSVLAPQPLPVDEVPRPPFVVANTGYMPIYALQAEFFDYLLQEPQPREEFSLISSNPGHWRLNVPELRPRTQVSFNMQLQAITAGHDTTKIVPLDRGELCAEITYVAWWLPRTTHQRIYLHTAKPDPTKLVWLESLPPAEACQDYIARRVAEADSHLFSRR